MDRFEVRVSITKLLLILIVVIVPLSIVGLVLTGRSDRALDDAMGNDFKALAQSYGGQVSEYVRDRVADVNGIAADTSVVSAVAAADNSAKGAAPANLVEAASQVLRQRRNLDPRFLNIVATDTNGNVVAAAQQGTKGSYAQDDEWQGVYNKGQGAVKISDILDDEMTKSYYVDIGVPVGDPNTGHLIGILTAAVNVTPVLARFQQAQIGNGARAALVNDDGSIVSAPNADVFARLKSEEYDAIRDSLGSLDGTQSGWTIANLRKAPYIVGFAATGLKQHFDNLGWVVLVSEDEHLAAAPIRQLEHFALAMVILAIFMLTLLCVYYFMHRAQKFEDIEQVLPSGPEGRAAAASV